MKRQPPHSEQELLERANTLTGKTIQSLANELGVVTPEQLLANKGWTGELIEHYLGASAGNAPAPDFCEIGVELKTLPIGPNNKPRESTYICVVSLLPDDTTRWETSLVKRKLARVLWVPVEGDPAIPLPQRRIGSAFLWSPDQSQENVLRNDWEELMEMVLTGKLEQITARYGKYLQIRPKGQNAKSLQAGIDAGGSIAPTQSRGFYLRTSFTNLILKLHHATGP